MPIVADLSARPDAIAVAIARAASALGWSDRLRRQPSAISTQTYGKPASSRMRSRSARSAGSSTPNCGTMINGCAPRVCARSRVARSTSRVIAMPRSTVRSLRNGTSRLASDASRPCCAAGSQARPGPRCGRLSSRFRPKIAGHEQRDDGHGLPEAGQFLHEPQIRLIAAEAVHGEVRALDPHHGTDLRWHAVLPHQTFPEHHGLADEHDRRPRGIDGFVRAPDTISGRIE